MKVYQTHQIRNVALAGHNGSGKTTLAEALLAIHGMIERRGTVAAGTTQSDYDPLEKARHCSISASLLPIELPETKINILDCPGFRDFVGEAKNAIRIAEMCLLVVDAETGVEVGTEFAFDYAREYNIPVAVVVNKMDKDRADFAHAMETIDQAFDAHTVPVTIPIGSGASFKGIIDLLDMKAVYDEGGKKRVEEIPADMMAAAKEARRRLIEAAAEGDDELTEHFLETETLTEEEVRKGLREDLQAGRFVPVVCCSAEKAIGLSGLVHFLVDECPSPDMRHGFRCHDDAEDPKSPIHFAKLDPAAPFSAYVFKTVNDDFAGRMSFIKVVTGEIAGDCMILNVTTGKQEKAGHIFDVRGKTHLNVDKLVTGDIGAFGKLTSVHTGDTLMDPKGTKVRYEPTRLPSATAAIAVRAKNKGEEDKIALGIHRILESDPTLTLERDSLLHQTILHGMGDVHLEVAVERLRAAAKIEVETYAPRVPYRETVTRTAKGQGKFKRQTGGRGQYGDCWLRIEPAPRGSGFEFAWEVVGGVIPTNFTGSVEKGLQASILRGIVAGYPVVDIKVACYDGSHHAVDSSDMAFQTAASIGFKNVAPQAGPAILEPIMRVQIDVPADYMGDVLGYLSSRRGRVQGSDQQGRRAIISAEVPLGEMGTFSRDLRSMTQGRSVYEMAHSHYEICPPAVQEKVARESKIVHAEAEE